MTESLRTRFAGSADWILQALTTAYLGLALLVFGVCALLAYNWLKVPFMGGLVEQSLVFNGIKPQNPGTWNATNQGLNFGDRLRAIQGIPVLNSAQIEGILKDYAPGEHVTLTILGGNGQERTIQVQLTGFPMADRIGYLMIPYLVGLIFLGSGLWIYGLRRSMPTGRAFAVFTASAAIGAGALFDLYTTHVFTYLWTAAIALAGGSILHLALIFPRPDRLALRYPWLPYLGYFPAAALAINAFIRLADRINPTSYASAWRAEYIYTGLAVLFFLVWITSRRITSISPIEREQARTILLGASGLAPLAIWFLVTSIRHDFVFWPYLLLPLAVFPIGTGYAMQRHRLLQTDYILSRVVLYGLMTVLAAGSYALLVSGLSLVLVNTISPSNPLVIGGMIFALVLVLAPVRERLQRAIDRVFFRGERTYQERIQTFSRDLTNAVSLTGILKILRQYIHQSLLPVQLHIFIFDPFSNHFIATPDESGRVTTDIRFAADSPLAKLLAANHVPFFINDQATLPAALLQDRTRLAILAARILIPLPGRQHLTGWLALGPRRSGELYTTHDLRYLESLSDQAALAIERAQVVANMEVQVHQTNVLARVAQGVNVTLSFDDILELIYAQTTQVIPARDFFLTIADYKSNTIQHAFYLLDDERLSDRENKPLAAGEGLEQEIIRSRHAILTEDYQGECQKRGILPASSHIFSWMSVPLNSGAETIGALSIGSRDPAVTYTQEQLNFLQAISDQAASAIVKTRLLQETEHRARQLATLNEVTRQLASTLDLEPLLQNILQNAVDILNCEAGSLLLSDETTGELVFQAAAGPVAENLVGKRLPPGSGVVGKAMNSHLPLIVNSVHQSSEWSSTIDSQTGFHTRSILVSPLQVKEDVIGVIEIINRLDGQPFSNDDLALLSAFASQAAVAIENARLYTQTDQALSARVEELSVMQRIDRELNTSLDISRAMHITLDWAMRQSGAMAGLVGIIQQSGLQIMASQGYTDELKPYADKPLPAGFQSIEAAIATGQVQQNVIDYGFESQALLNGAGSQAIIPIRRETTVIGIILLESTQNEFGSEDSLSFLSRLSDHASIAISNAQLFAAVQDANSAKSEFVSFVSHELKNPMTSIKGYTELLAAGAVGPITPAQANFLSTIRSNIERMNTLVSDLNDVSKIEAGRLRLEFKSFAIQDVIDDTLRSTRRQIEEKKQELTLDLPVNLPAVWADRTRVTQVLVNLINNAYKYTPQNGQIILAGVACANQWDPGGPPQVVHISVQDNGIGINPEDQKKIFQKFFRSEDPKTREVPGTGLGLNITRSLVEMQGGRIWFESQFRVGTIFHFTVPIAE